MKLLGAPLVRLAAVLWALPWLGACGPAPGLAKRDVVLVILDTVRADHLSCYGYPRSTTPQLDRLAAEGLLYENAWAQAPWTLPAVATILTGQAPHVHGAGRRGDVLLPVREEVPNLAQRLSGAGYRTAAFVNVVFCGPPSGLGRGFERYDYHQTDATNTGHRGAAETTDAALRWAAGVGDAPFFLWVHYFDPHLTYDPPEPHDTMFEDAAAERIPRGFGSAEQVFALREGRLVLSEAQRRSLVARYDGELHYTDTQFGRLRAGLEKLGRWDSALVIVVADHGEEFWDHGGFEHGHSHFRELLHVPLLVRRPEGPAGRRATERVRQLDIVPTVLGWAGLAVPDDLPGSALGTGGSTLSVAEGTLWGGDIVSVRSDAGTLILNRSSGDRQFFLGTDAREARDRWAERPAAAANLERLAASVPALDALAGERWEPSEEELEQLRALGYVQ